MKALSVIILIFFSCLTAPAQQDTNAFQKNALLGRGINMGNAFEAPTETAWGNPWKPEYFEIMAEMGFQHVRLPIRWETEERSMAEAPYTITPSFLERIKKVVDNALSNDLIIIINMHHHELLFEDPEGQKDRFLAQWEQIADYFKDYPEELFFEVLNEPHGNLTPVLWNEFFADALNEIRKTNPDRIVLMGTADFGGLSGLPYLEVPEDESVIVSVHYYNPFTFTHQGAEWIGTEADAWLGTTWQDTEAEREAVIQEFAPAFAFSETYNVPIHVGEFGAYSKADLESRVKWTTFLARWFEEQNLSWAYWEFSAGFGIYDPSTNEVLQPLMDALLHNEMPDPVPIEAVSIYQSNFSQDTDGWTLSVQNGLNANLSASEDKLKVSITNAGTEGWHVQLVKNNIALHNGKMYRLSVTATATAVRSATMYAGKASSPWNSYSGYNSLGLSTVESTFSTTFTMNDPTDLEARLVFDLGISNEDVHISEVKLEEIIIGTDPDPDPDPDPVTSIFIPGNNEISVYPNPFYGSLHITNLQDYSKAFLFDLRGSLLDIFELQGSASSLDLEKYHPGTYILKLNGLNRAGKHFKIFKE